MVDNTAAAAGIISIHASRVGGDAAYAPAALIAANFNPRLPSGRRREAPASDEGQAVADAGQISIHASRVGGDAL